MSHSIDQRVVQMQFDNKQFERGVRTTTRTLEDFKRTLDFDIALRSFYSMADGVDHISSRFSALGAIGFTVIQNLTNAAMDFGKKVSKLVIDPIVEGGRKRALNTEQAMFQFKGLGMDVESAMDSARKAVAGTAYGLDEAAMAAAQLGASGVKAGDDMTEALTAISGLAAMTNSDYTSMSRIMTTIAGNGRLMGDQLLQFSTRGLNVAATLAEALGKTEGQIREMVSAGKIDFNTFAKAMYNAFGEHASKANETYSGSLMNVRAALARVGETAATPVHESLRKTFVALIPVINEVHDAIKPLIGRFTDFVDLISGDIVNFLERLNLKTLSASAKEFGNAMSNVFKGIHSVLSPIKEAFTDIFPPMTANRLLALSKTLSEATSYFKIGETAAEGLKNTFKGLFAVVDVGLYILTGFINVLARIAYWLSPIGTAIITITGSMGTFVVAVRDAIKGSDGLYNIFKSIVDILQPVGEGIRNVAIVVAEGLASIGSADTTNVETLSNKIEKALTPVMVVGEGFKNTMASMVEIIAAFTAVIVSTLGKLTDKITDELKDMKFETFIKLINGVLIMGILNTIKKFVKGLKDLSTDGRAISRDLLGILDGIRGVLESYQQNIQAKTLFLIAGSIAMLAASLIALSMIESDKLDQSLTAISVLFAQMFIATGIFGKLLSVTKLMQSARTIVTIQGLAIAVFILAAAMERVAVLDWGGLAKGTIAIATLMLVLVQSSKAISGATPGLTKAALGLIAFAAAIRILVESVKALSELDVAGLTKGLVGLGVLLAELVIFMKVADLSGMGPIKTLGLINLALALNVLAYAIEKISTLDVDELAKGLGSLAILLASLAIFVNATSGAKGVITTATGLILLGTAMIMFSDGVEKLGAISIPTIATGLGAMGSALFLIAAAMKLMPMNLLITGAGLVVMSAALTGLAMVLTVLGSMPLANIGNAIIMLATSLTILALAANAMSGSLLGATSLMVIAGALALLIPSLVLLSTIPLPGVAAALLILAGAFGIIGAAGALLAPIIPTLYALGGAILVLGAGMLAVAGSFTIFATGIALLSTNLIAFVETFIKSIDKVTMAIPTIFKLFVETIKAFADMLEEALPHLVKAITLLIESMIDAVRISLPKIVDLFLEMLVDILTKLDNVIPEIVERGFNIVIGLLKGIASKLPEVIDAGTDVVVNFIYGMITQMDRLVQAAFDLMVSFLQSLATAIDKNSDIVLESITTLVLTIISVATEALGEGVTAFFDAGVDLITGFIDGIKSMVVGVIEAISDLAGAALEAAKKALDQRSPSRKFEEIGKNTVAGLVVGIEKNSPKAEKASADMSKRVVKAGSDAAKKEAEKAAKERAQREREEFNASVAWIDERKFYQKMALNEELEAWKRIQKRYLAGTEERKRADREVYNLKNQIINAEKRYAQEVIAVTQNAVDEKIRLEEQYYDNVKQINDRLIRDIKSVEDAYENSLKQRTDSLYNAFGLFDAVEVKAPVDGATLVKNLEDQIVEFETWQETLNDLSRKGVDEGLIKELRDMGPKSLAEIKALNNLSQPELDNYVYLWKTKTRLAKTEAVNQLTDLRKESDQKIRELKIQAEKDLDEQKQIWEDSMKELSERTVAQLTQLKEDFISVVGDLRTDSQKEFTKLTDDIIKTVEKPDWYGVGGNIVDGMKSGVEGNARKLADAAAKAALDALRAAEEALGIQSPSTKFAELGRYSILGFVGGLQKYAKNASDTASNVGMNIVAAFNEAVAYISSLVDETIDAEPVIRPVVDMSNVEASGLLISSIFTKAHNLNVGSVMRRVPVIMDNTPTNKSDVSKQLLDKPISFVQNNYSPKALSRLEIYRQTRNQISTMKGLVDSV